MEPAAQDGQPKEQRILAAIVFTDVVGFSKLAAANEARVYTSLQRDMGVITQLCRAHSGQVLNTMGDGMLLCFGSAVDAMACAVEIQRTLYSQSLTLPAQDVLHHRIGVHLGDIIMSGDNVFGDGVNIAARLQAEAKPDGICFSRTVNEVIKNKLKINAQYLAPRQLKNIGKVEIWQIPPIAEAQQQQVAEALSVPQVEEKKDHAGAVGYKAMALIVAAIACLVVVVVIIKVAANKIPPSAAPGSVRNSKNSPLNQLTKSKLGSALAGAAPQEDASTATEIAPPPKATKVELQAKLDDLKKSYAFDQVAAYLAGDGKTLPDAPAMEESFLQLVKMKQWLDGEMDSSTLSNPVGATMMIDGAQVPVTMYRGSSLGSYTMLNTASGQTQEVRFADLGTLGIQNLVQGVISHPIRQTEPNASVWLAEFQRQYPAQQ